MAAKMNPKFVALSALAVGAIYASGYGISATSTTALAASSRTSSSGTPTSRSSGSTPSGSAAAATSTAANSASAQTNASSSKPGSSGSARTQQYLDGTYTGSAANQIGAVGVAVTIKNGKISNVQITSCYTHYPESYINPVLPDYVVSHQTTRIPIVSGATLSTEDFYYAVTQALSKAQNPNYKG